MLRKRLLERQRELGLRDGAMADRLGIPRTSYNSIKVGRYRISLEVARQIVGVFPDLAQFVLEPDPPEMDHPSL